MNRKVILLQKKFEIDVELEVIKEVYYFNFVLKFRIRGGDFGFSRLYRLEQYNLYFYWMVEEAERRRKVDNKRYFVYGGLIKSVYLEGLVNRWRDDTFISKQ